MKGYESSDIDPLDEINATSPVREKKPKVEEFGSRKGSLQYGAKSTQCIAT